MLYSSICPIDRILLGATTPRQSGPGSDGNEGELWIPQSSSITGVSPADCVVSYARHSMGGILPICRDAVCILQPQLTTLIYKCVFVLVFLLLSSVSVYHGYTSADIGPNWVGTWLNIFPTSKHYSFIIYKSTNRLLKLVFLSSYSSK